MSAEPASNDIICLSTLRETDRDRYLVALLSPEARRRALVALYVYNAEIAKVRDLVHEPLPGEVRLQWWRDIIEGQNPGQAEANPLSAELMAAVHACRLPTAPLIAMSEARIFDLYDDPMPDVATLEAYAGETASALIQLASLVLSPEKAGESAAAAGHAGVAQTVAGLLLLMPRHRQRGQLYLPLDILSATGLDRESFLEGQDRERIGAAITAFAALGMDHLKKARAEERPSPEVFPAFLPVALAESVLKKAMKLKASIFDEALQLSQWRRQLTLARAAFTKRF
ncbi:phytoene/squalene synthase family protein [Rhizobium sp. PAMB 3182]